jgi:hypothetical protein
MRILVFIMIKFNWKQNLNLELRNGFTRNEGTFGGM